MKKERKKTDNDRQKERKQNKKESIKDRKKKVSKKRERQEWGIQGGRVVLSVKFSRFSPTVDPGGWGFEQQPWATEKSTFLGYRKGVGIGAYPDM